MSKIDSFQTMMAEMGDKAGSQYTAHPDVADTYIKRTQQKIRFVSARVVSGARGPTYYLRNSLDNGTFDGDLNAWTQTIHAANTATTSLNSNNGRVESDAQSGPDALEVDITNSSGAGVSGRYQDVTASATQVWSVTAYKKLVSKTNGGGVKLYLAFLDSGGSVLADHDTDDTVLDSAYELISNLNRTAPSTTTTVRIGCYGLTASSGDKAEILWDDIMLHIGSAAPGRTDNMVAGFFKAT
jgi:hypothetical protein